MRDLATGRYVRLQRASLRGMTSAAETALSTAALFLTRSGWTRVDRIERERSCVDVWERWRPHAIASEVTRLVAGLDDMLDAASYGTPRIIWLPAINRLAHEALVRVAARRTRQAGWVPIDLGLLTALGTRGWPSWLTDRSLVVFAEQGNGSGGRFERLQELGVVNLRPHVVVCRPSSSRRVALVSEPAGASRARETALAYGLQAAAPGFTVRDEARARWHLIGDELARKPVAQLIRSRARLAIVLGERDQSFEARSHLDRCRAGGSKALREVHVAGARLDDIRRQHAAARLEQWLGRGNPERRWTMVDDFVGVLQLCHETEDDHVALAKVGAFVRERLRAASVAFVAPLGGELRVLSRAGGEAPSLAAARRSIECGCHVPASSDRGPQESASPVRHAAEVIGALWCRWSAGTPIAIAEAGTLLGVAAAASGPSLRSLVERLMPIPVTANAAPELVGESAPMRGVRAAILRAATSPFPVLIEGESGSGKELAARAIHACGPRRERRLCAINCAALVDDLVEAELFGHARGAFTGAVGDRAGLFEEANGGTLFLDEVAELGGRVQAKLLRALQEGEVRRIGEATLRKVDARIVAATNRPLAGEVSSGRFRRDLWYRLDVIRMAMPPLRERLEDLPMLVRHLWTTLSDRAGSRATLSAAAVAALGCYDWPGNVRELQNVLASALVAAPRRGVLGPSVWPAHVVRAAALAPASTLDVARRQFDERFVRAAMARAGGRTSVAARELGLSRQGLAKLLARLGIDGQAGLAPPSP